ncbi:hypothetical protein BsWGS_04997 [Bradybaena similaris]
MKKRAEPNNGSKSDTDRAKRIYRAALESIKCLDSINTGKKAYREVFSPDAVGLRNKLKDYCERLMFFNPVEYGRKAEEVLWRKVFYDVIQVVKRSKNHIRHHGSVETAYRTHLAAAAGYYQHLVFRLQREFSLRLAGVIDYHQLPEIRAGRRNDMTSVKTINPSIQEWAQRACHRCLICLGDISRYICDVDRMSIPTTAARYYHQAFMLFPEIGMPHNQLGTLAGSRYSGCEAAYHYVRCLACEKPFEGARGNLARLFEKNSKRFHELNTPQARDLPPDEQRHQDIKRFFTRFFKLLEIFHGTSNNIEMTELQQLCQLTLQDFNLCMFYEPHHQLRQSDLPGGPDSRDFQDDDFDEFMDPGDPASFQYLDNGIVFKIFGCLMCTIHLLEKNGSTNITAATAFLLALFSHLLNHVVIRLQGCLEDMEHPNKILIAGSSLSSENMHNEESSGSEDEQARHMGDHAQQNSQDSMAKSAKNGGSKIQPKKSRVSTLRGLRRRRPRRRDMSESSDNMSDLSEASDLSEGNDDVDEHLVSSDSENYDDLASYFDHGSDSDLSEAEDILDNEVKTNSNNAHSVNTEHDNWSLSGKGLPNGDMKHIWLNGTGDKSLADISSELFSSSLMFLGQDLAQSSQLADVFNTKERVLVPPGFNSSEEAKHVAEITEKLANFDIETDTETIHNFTDTEQTDAFAETEEMDHERNNSSATGRQELQQQKLMQVLEVIQSEGLLPTVKVMCDWMRSQASIISVCAQSSYNLWQRLSVLLNFLPHETDIVQHSMCWVPELQVIVKQTKFPDWTQVFPLTEDIELCQLPPLADIHSQVDFTTRHRAQLSDIQETFLRICCLRHFGYFLTSIESIDFTYKADTSIFFGPSSSSDLTVNNCSQECMERLKDAENRRNQLMRDMAQLRLQAEVNELEGSLKTSEHWVFPPYVVADDTALCNYLGKVKELTQTARCIVVIPVAVVDSLDMQKKDSANAREVIRWLETQLRRGNRYIRAQRSKETLSLNQYGIHKKKNRDAWYILELLGCARYLAQQTGSFTGHSVVAIITGRQKLVTPTLPPIIQQIKSQAEQEGVTIETMVDFGNRWKSVLQQTGEG